MNRGPDPGPQAKPQDPQAVSLIFGCGLTNLEGLTTERGRITCQRQRGVKPALRGEVVKG
jgi:hypothetical protein